MNIRIFDCPVMLQYWFWICIQELPVMLCLGQLPRRSVLYKNEIKVPQPLAFKVCVWEWFGFVVYPSCLAAKKRKPPRGQGAPRSPKNHMQNHPASFLYRESRKILECRPPIGNQGLLPQSFHEAFLTEALQQDKPPRPCMSVVSRYSWKEAQRNCCKKACAPQIKNPRFLSGVL